MVYLGTLYIAGKFEIDLSGGVILLAWLADVVGIIGTTVVLYGVYC